MDFLTGLLVFAVGVIASFIGGLAGGGGGLLSIPALTIFGLPANTAVATNRFGALGNGISSSTRFFQGKKIVFKYVLPLAAISVVGSIIGARLLLAVDKVILSKVIGVFILLMLPLLFLKKDMGLKKKLVSKGYKFAGFAAYFVVAIYDGFLGAGAGLIVIFILVYLFGLTIIEANATDKIPWFINTIISTIIFAAYGLINYLFGIILLAGMLIGGYLGAHVAIKKGNTFVKIIFVIVVLASVAKMLFF